MQFLPELKKWIFYYFEKKHQFFFIFLQKKDKQLLTPEVISGFLPEISFELYQTQVRKKEVEES